MSPVERLSRSFVPVWWLSGDPGARVLVDRAVQDLVAWGKERCGIPGFNLSVTDADDLDPGQVVALAGTVPMMSDLRVVVVRKLDAAKDDLLQALVRYAEAPSPTTLLVLSGEKFPTNRNKDATDWAVELSRAVRRGGGEVVYYGTRDVIPADHARAHAESLGKQLSPSAARALVAICGPELAPLEREVEKLAEYCADQDEIDEASVAACASILAEAEVWDLTGAIAARRPDQAVVLMQRLLEDGEAPHKLIAMVSWQVRQMLSAIALMRAGASADTASRTSGLKRHLVDRLDRTMIEEPGALDAAGVIERIAAANHAMNSRRVGDRAAFEQLVLALCGRS